MKCPRCSSENKDSYTVCYRCGQILHPKTDEPAAPAATGASLLWQKKASKAPKPAPDVIVLDDDAEPVYSDPELQEQGVPLPSNQEKLAGRADGQEVRVVVPPAPRKRSRRPSRYKINWGRFVIATILMLGLSAGVAFGGYTLVRLAINAVSKVFASRNVSAQDINEPLVEKVMIDGNAWHRITFYGKDGELVLVDDPRRSIPIENGKAELLLDDAGYISADMTMAEDDILVQLNASIFDKDGNERVVHVPPYTIEVPVSPLKIILPADETAPTNENLVIIKIQVTPGSRVLIGDNNVTDRINSDGFVSSSVSLEAQGVNSIPISVETPKHRKNVYEMKINRPAMDVPINLAGDSPQTTYDGAIEIAGTTDPGATISTTATVNGQITTEASGQFRLTVALPIYGWNQIELTAHSSDGRQSTMVYKINRAPDLESYSKKAWPMDYDSLSASPDALVGKVFVCQGYIVKKLESDTSEYYLFNVKTPETPQYIVMENTANAVFVPDQYYKIYADVLGEYDNNPLLAARFVYETDAPAGASNAGKAANNTAG